MYDADAIGGGDWGKQSDDFLSDRFYDDTLKDLKKVAREHHPILQTIENREWEAKRLYSDYPLRPDDLELSSSLCLPTTLEDLMRAEIQENGKDGKDLNTLHDVDTERAKTLLAALGWRENSDEIKKLEEELHEAQTAMYCTRKGESDEERETYEQNRQKLREVERSLENTKQHAIEKYTGWHKDYYDFRSDFENFLSGIVYHRRTFREQLYSDEQIKELIQKYFENPSWHLPQITDFLLTDLIDSDLIRLETDFQLGLFSDDLANKLGYYSLNSFFSPSIWAGSSLTSPTLSPGSKRKRSGWRARNFLIGAGLIGAGLISSVDGYLETWISKDWLRWILPTILAFGCYLISDVLYSFVGEAINKRRIDIKSWRRKAHTLLNIRWDILSGIYDAKTCIERLKRIDEPLYISSLVYRLLELQKRLQTLP